MRLRILGPAVLAMAFSTPLPAADRLPVEPAARSCPGYGPGFVEVPGTSTCIRIGGRVRSEAGASTNRAAGGSTTGFRNSGQISMDTRTGTAYGPLRTFVRLRAASDTLPGSR